MNGTKFHTTESLHADWLGIAAHAEDGNQVTLQIPAHREGVIHLDDWDRIANVR